jgi:hypothetical protein
MIRSMTGAKLLILLLCFLNQKVNAQTINGYSEEVQNRIKSVEENLRAWTKIKGQSEWTLAERMKY